MKVSEVISNQLNDAWNRNTWGDVFYNAKIYGAKGDGVFDNTAVFSEIEALPGQLVILPEGTYIVNGLSLTKRYIGPGKIKLNGVMQANIYTVIRSLPSAGANAADYFGGDQRKIDAEYFEIASGVPVSTVTSNYYNWELQPHLSNFWVKSGYSGFTTKTTGTNNSGQNVVNVRNTADLAAGMQVIIGSDTYTISLVNSSTQFTTTTNLTNTYSASTWVSKGNRTMFDDYFSNLFHLAGGDAYSYMSRVVAAKAPDADQTHFSYNSTAGIMGGDLTGVESGVYLTGTEMNFIDENYLGTHDIAVVGDIRSFQRKNDTGARGAVWVGTLLKSEGTKYAESAHVVAGKWKGGLDLIWADFGADKAAIKLAPDQRIFFDGSAVADEAGYQMWGQNPGDTYMCYSSGLSQMQSIVNGATGLSWTATEVYAPGNINLPQTKYLNLNGGIDITGFKYTGSQLQFRFNDVTAFSIVQATSDMFGLGNVNIPAGKMFNVDNGGTLTGMRKNASTGALELVKNGVVVATY